MFEPVACQVRLGPFDLDSVSFRDCDLKVDFGGVLQGPVRIKYKRQGQPGL